MFIGFEAFKGRVMGPLLVLVCLCFREIVIVTCKIVLFWFFFLRSIDNFLLKKCIFSPLEISFEKRASFDLLFTFLSHHLKDTKIPSAHISLTYIHVFCSPYRHFLPYQFCKNYEFTMYGFSLVRLLVLIIISAILEQSINNYINGEQNLSWNVYY